MNATFAVGSIVQILEIYDAEPERGTGIPHKTLLDPVPADWSRRHTVGRSPA